MKFGVSLTPTLTTSHSGFYDIAFNSVGLLLSASNLNIDTTLLVSGVSLDRSSGKLYILGSRNTSSFPGMSMYSYIGALSPSRDVIWIDTVSNPYSPTSTAGFTSIAADGWGHLYATIGGTKGFAYRGDTVWNEWGLLQAVTSVAKLDTGGNVMWFRPYSSTITSGMNRITLAPNQKVAVCGYIAGGKIVTGLDTITAFAGEGQNTIFSIVDSAGYVQSFEQMHGPGFYDKGNAMACDRVGNLYVVGKVESSISMGSVPPYTSVGGDSDYFIFKYGVDCSCTSMPVANYTYSGTDLNRSFTYTGTLTGIDSVRWTFGDGGTSTSMSPVHTYTGSGTFTTCIRVYSNCGSDMRCQEVAVACATSVTSNFVDTGVLIHGFTYTGTTAGYDSVVWDLGDGFFDTGLFVSHTYAVADTYHVCAKVYSNCGTHTYCKDIYVNVPGFVGDASLAGVRVFPNPGHNELTIVNLPVNTEYRIINVVGTTMQRGTLRRSRDLLNIESLPTGTYLLELSGADSSRKVVRFVKQ
ncbi:MAG: T9SS type A sorting domain-containing protein [Taibaiella sp.]|nr:T9SS type A sorting domain-containing protein [Taibaiella sp.]